MKIKDSFPGLKRGDWASKYLRNRCRWIGELGFFGSRGEGGMGPWNGLYIIDCQCFEFGRVGRFGGCYW